MYNFDEQYIILDNLIQGQKFKYNDEYLMKLPINVEVYGNRTNVINIKTGTMYWLNPLTLIDQDTII